MKTHTTGVTTLRTTTDITTVRTASVHHGTGAVTMTLGIGTHGHIIAHGDSTDGITTIAGIMTDGTTVAGTTHGITAVLGDSMTLGTTEDGTVAGIHTTHIMQDGTAASAGIHITTIITRATSSSQEVLQIKIISEVRDIRPVQKDFQQAEAVHSEAAQASEAQSAETLQQYRHLPAAQATVQPAEQSAGIW